MTKVKICGLMESKHVKAAVEAGADAIGFVFADSSRRVTVNEAKELARGIPDNVLKIGVFVDAPRQEMERAFREVPLDFIQFHGNESENFVESVGLPSIRALSVAGVEDVATAARYKADYYLFDAPGTVYKGGSGVTFDWGHLQGSGISMKQLILAGGLNVENVGEAIRRVNPFMVDVSSGVELNKRKDAALIHAFVRAVKDGER